MNFVPKISYDNHLIPETNVTCFLNNKIYFFHNKSISFYDISTKKIEIFKRIENVTSLFIVKNVLCALYANKLTVYADEERIVKLADIPINLVLDNNAVGFLYKDSMEIFNLSKISLINFGGLKITDIASEGNYSYLLCNKDVYKVKNVFITFQITKPLKIHSSEESFERIFMHKNILFLKSQNSLFKYSIFENTAILEYSFKFEKFRNFLSNYFVGKTLSYLGNAPILILNDEISNFFLLEGVNYVGISPSRIYYIEEDTDKCHKTPNKDFLDDFSDFTKNITINENEIKVPEEFEDLKTQYIDVEVKLLKYERMLTKVQEIDSKMEKREHELRFEHKKLRDEIILLEEKEKNVKERIERLTKKARKILVGDCSKFYELISKLEGLLDNKKSFDVDFKEIFKMQRAALRSKLEFK
jgi:hypothetical protein